MEMTKEQFTAKLQTSLRTEEFLVPELGDSVTIRELSGTERDRVDARRIMEQDKAAVLHDNSIYILSVALLGKDGKPLYTADELRTHYESNRKLFRSIADRIVDLSDASPYVANKEELRKN